MSPRLIRLAACIAGLAVPLLGHAAPALAGTYSFDTDTTSELSGWLADGDPGYALCSRVSLPGPCNDTDVARPTPLRIFGLGSAAADTNGHWYWVAPPTTSFVHGAVTLTYRTDDPDTSVYLKARKRPEVFANVGRARTATDAGTGTWGVPAGEEAFGIFLANGASTKYTSKWANNVKITSFSATLRDDVAPSVALSGALADGLWHGESQPVCVHVAAHDAGAGVVSAELRGEAGAVLDRVAGKGKTPAQPGEVDFDHDLCVTPAALADGARDLSVHVVDGAGEVTVAPLVLHVDATAPVAVDPTPLHTAERRPAITFSVDAGPSGLASFDAAVDGLAMTVTGDAAAFTPTEDLAFGPHTVTWRAADHAGNVRDGFWTFQVVDDVAPVLSGAQPADGTSGEERRPPIAFRVDDAGTGVDASSLRVLLDGQDVAGLGTLANGAFSFVPDADLGFGPHTVRVLVSDRWGNAMAPARWTFTVVDATPPALADVRPDDGSSGSDRTPVVSFAAGDGGGTGVDPSSLQLLLDGDEVSARASWDGARFTYGPTAPLGFGVHTVSARVADHAGNVSATLTWSFEVRDETAPVVSARMPAPGSTVAGAAVIGFDVSDSGTGVDPASLQVTVDASDVTAWGTFVGGSFRYAPGNLGAGVHTISVSVADRSGNAAGPVVWQFAVADPATLRLAAGGPTAVVAGGRAVLTWRATSNGDPLAGARLELSSRPAGRSSFTSLRTLTASPAGVVRVKVSPAVTTTYRATLAADGSVGAERTLVVHRRVSLASSAARLRRGAALRLSGAVAPAAPGAAVALQMLTRSGWRTVAHPRLGRRSTFATVVVPRVPGRYVFRAVAPATSRNAAGTSRALAVRVR